MVDDNFEPIFEAKHGTTTHIKPKLQFCSEIDGEKFPNDKFKAGARRMILNSFQ